MDESRLNALVREMTATAREIERYERAHEDRTAQTSVLPEQLLGERLERWLERCRRWVPARQEGESWLEYVRRYQKAHRVTLLREAVPDNRCPVCKEIKVKSRQWVVVRPRHDGHRPRRVVLLLKRLTCAAAAGRVDPRAYKMLTIVGAVCRSCYNKYLIPR